MRAILTKGALQVAFAAEQSSDRHNLECVKIGNGEIIASDGYLLAKCRITTEPSEGEQILVSAKDIIAATRLTEYGDIILKTEGEIVILENKYRDMLIVGQLYHGDYLKMDKVPPKNEARTHVMLQKRLLDKALKIIKVNDSISVDVWVSGPDKPVVFSSDGIMVYLMPIYRPQTE